MLFLLAFAWLIPSASNAGEKSSGLEFSAGQRAELVWETEPTLGVESRLHLQWLEAGGRFSPPAFRVRLWMPMHNHGSSPVEIRPVIGPDGNPVKGAFRVAKIYFTMKGLWELQISLRADDGSEETRSLPIDLGRGHD